MDFQLETEISDNNEQKLRKSSILIVSNGHGEDLVASKIISSVFNLFPEIDIKVYPLVGLGDIFLNPEYQDKITILNPRKVMPSGGFCMQSIISFIKDINHGLLNLIFMQGYLKIIYKNGKSGLDLHLILICTILRSLQVLGIIQVI